ncbi:MAG TPA: methyltransferase domain-containing protein [Gemmatimonadota bacterium]|nr:methyltransferase domain-containing protein [Gemmatimonadota bacterium]
MTRERVRPSARGDRLFAPLAADYAAARPSYPAPVFELLRTRVENRPRGAGEAAPLVVDVAAGTGIATVGLLDSGLRVAAVEPATGMLVEAVRSLAVRPGWAGGVAARAEALPLADASVAAVVVAQAFHWLDPRHALDEFARVIEAGGVLLLLWNVTEPDAFTLDVRRLVGRHNPGRKRPVTPRMREIPASLRNHPAFAVEPTVTVEHRRALALDDYVRYARSWSYVGGALEPAALDAFESDLRGVLERHAREGRVVERFETAAHFARRL